MPDLLEKILLDQNDLSAVERFSEFHEQKGLLREDTYKDLIPLSQPTAGQQYAFEVDLDACTGCKACVVGCHSLNGLEEGETWRKTGVLQSYGEARPFQQTVTTACHHCVEPGCLQGCPVKAYDKDPTTGIVKHLDDQCFGCRYCEIKCPYGVPQYSERLGVVRKCDMCSSRLADQEAPACVQSCPNQAIKITIVNQSEADEIAKKSFNLIKDAPSSHYTQPTTVYKSNRGQPLQLQAADINQIQPEHPHWPLVIMLTLTQISVGVWTVSLFLAGISSAQSLYDHRYLMLFGMILGGIGLAVAPLHLGRPHLAFRAFLGFRTSWLSREMLTFGPYPVLGGLCLACLFEDMWQPKLNINFNLLPLSPYLAIPTVLIGLVGVFCSAMIYIDTPRPFWAHVRTLLKFTFTSFSSGALLFAFSSVMLGFSHVPSLFIAIICCFAKLYFETDIFSSTNFDVKRTVYLLSHHLKSIYDLRRKLGVVAGLFIPLLAVMLPTGFLISIMLALACVGWMIAEMMERYLFFTSVVPPRMPGDQLA